MLTLERPQFKWIVRTVALVTVVCFVMQDVVFAQGGTPTWSQARGRENSRVSGERLIDQIEVPYDVGVTRSVRPSASDEIVVNIQDAHASLGAQKSISQIIENLVRHYELDLVGIEGTAGVVDTSIVSSFPMENVRKGAAESLLAETKISGSEFYKILSGSKIELYGLEDLDLYSANVESFRKVLAEKERIQKELAGVFGVLKELEQKIFPSEIVEINRNGILHRNGDIKFGEHWKGFRASADKAGVSYKKFANIEKLVRTVELENEIDFKKADAERTLLIDELKTVLAKSDLDRLTLSALQYKLGKITPADFHTLLAELAERAAADPKAYPNLILSVQYLRLFEDIDLVAIFDEIDRMEEEVKTRLFRTDEERELNLYLKTVGVLSKLLDASMSSTDDRFWREHRELFDMGRIGEFLSQTTAKHGVAWEKAADLEYLAAQLPEAEAFYRHVHARNDALLNNLVRRMREKDQKVAAIVTGGFHSDELSDLMMQRRLSHIVLMPKISEGDPQRPYLAVITEKGSFLDREVRVKAQEEAIALVIGLAALGGMKFEEAKRLYLESYRNEAAKRDGGAAVTPAGPAETAAVRSVPAANEGADRAVATTSFFPAGFGRGMTGDDVETFASGLLSLGTTGSRTILIQTPEDSAHRGLVLEVRDADARTATAASVRQSALSRDDLNRRRRLVELGQAERAFTEAARGAEILQRELARDIEFEGRAAAEEALAAFERGHAVTGRTTEQTIRRGIEETLAPIRRDGIMIDSAWLAVQEKEITGRLLAKKSVATATTSQRRSAVDERREILRNLIEDGHVITLDTATRLLNEFFAESGPGAVPVSRDTVRNDLLEIRRRSGIAYREAGAGSKRVTYYFSLRIPSIQTERGALKRGGVLLSELERIAQEPILTAAIRRAEPVAAKTAPVQAPTPDTSAEVARLAPTLVQQLSSYVVTLDSDPQAILGEVMDRLKIPPELRETLAAQPDLSREAQRTVTRAKAEIDRLETDLEATAQSVIGYLDRMSVRKGDRPGAPNALERDAERRREPSWKIRDHLRNLPEVVLASQRAHDRLEAERNEILSRSTGWARALSRGFLPVLVVGVFVGIIVSSPWIIAGAVLLQAGLMATAAVLGTNWVRNRIFGAYLAWASYSSRAKPESRTRRRSVSFPAAFERLPQLRYLSGTPLALDSFDDDVVALVDMAEDAASAVENHEILTGSMVDRGPLTPPAGDLAGTQLLPDDLSAASVDAAMIEGVWMPDTDIILPAGNLEGGLVALDLVSFDPLDDIMDSLVAEPPVGATSLQVNPIYTRTVQDSFGLGLTVQENINPDGVSYSVAVVEEGIGGGVPGKFRGSIGLSQSDTVLRPDLIDFFGDEDEFVVVQLHNDATPNEGRVYVFHRNESNLSVVRGDLDGKSGTSEGDADRLRPIEVDSDFKVVAKGEGAYLVIGPDLDKLPAGSPIDRGNLDIKIFQIREPHPSEEVVAVEPLPTGDLGIDVPLSPTLEELPQLTYVSDTPPATDLPAADAAILVVVTEEAASAVENHEILTGSTVDRGPLTPPAGDLAGTQLLPDDLSAASVDAAMIEEVFTPEIDILSPAGNLDGALVALDLVSFDPLDDIADSLVAEPPVGATSLQVNPIYTRTVQDSFGLGLTVQENVNPDGVSYSVAVVEEGIGGGVPGKFRGSVGVGQSDTVLRPDLIDFFGDEDEFVVVQLHNDATPNEGRVYVFHRSEDGILVVERDIDDKPGTSEGDADRLRPIEVDSDFKVIAKGEGAYLVIGLDLDKLPAGSPIDRGNPDIKIFQIREAHPSKKVIGLGPSSVGVGGPGIGGPAGVGGPGIGGSGIGVPGGGGSGPGGFGVSFLNGTEGGLHIRELPLTNREQGTDPVPAEPADWNVPVVVGTVREENIEADLVFRPDAETPRDEGRYAVTLRVDGENIGEVDIFGEPTDRGLDIHIGDRARDLSYIKAYDNHLIVPVYVMTDGAVDPGRSRVLVIERDPKTGKIIDVVRIAGDPDTVSVELADAGKTLVVGDRRFNLRPMGAAAEAAAQKAPAPVPAPAVPAAPAAAAPQAAAAEEAPGGFFENAVRIASAVFLTAVTMGLWYFFAARRKAREKEAARAREAALPAAEERAPPTGARATLGRRNFLQIGVAAVAGLLSGKSEPLQGQEPLTNDLQDLYQQRKAAQRELMRLQSVSAERWRNFDFVLTQHVNQAAVAWAVLGGERPEAEWDQLAGVPGEPRFRLGRYRYPSPMGPYKDAFARQSDVRGRTVRTFRTPEEALAAIPEARRKELMTPGRFMVPLNLESGEFSVIYPMSQMRVVDGEDREKPLALVDRVASKDPSRQAPQLVVHPASAKGAFWYQGIFKNGTSYPAVASEVPLSSDGLAQHRRIEKRIRDQGYHPGFQIIEDPARGPLVYYTSLNAMSNNPGSLVLLRPDTTGPFVDSEYRPNQEPLVTRYAKGSERLIVGSGATFGVRHLPGAAAVHEDYERFVAEGGTFTADARDADESRPELRRLSFKYGEEAFVKGKEAFDAWLEAQAQAIKATSDPAVRRMIRQSVSAATQSMVWIDAEGLHSIRKPNSIVLGEAREAQRSVDNQRAVVAKLNGLIDAKEKERRLPGGARVAIPAAAVVAAPAAARPTAVSRRDFLKFGAAAGAGLVLSTAEPLMGQSARPAIAPALSPGQKAQTLGPLGFTPQRVQGPVAESTPLADPSREEPLEPGQSYSHDLVKPLDVGFPSPQYDDINPPPQVRPLVWHRLFGKPSGPDLGDDGMGRKWFAVSDPSHTVVEIVVLDIAGKPEFVLGGNIAARLKQGDARALGDIILSPTGEFTPLPKGTLLFFETHTDIRRDRRDRDKNKDKSQRIGSDTYTVNTRGGVQADQYPIDTQKDPAVDGEGNPINPRAVSSMEREFDLATLGELEYEGAEGKRIKTHRYLVSLKQQFQKHADGRILRQQAGATTVPKSIDSLVWKDPGGAPIWVWDGETLTHIVYDGQGEALHFSYEVAAGAIPHPSTIDPANPPALPNPEEVQRVRLASFAENGGWTGSVTRPDETVDTPQRVMLKHELLYDPQVLKTGGDQIYDLSGKPLPQAQMDILRSNPESPEGFRILRGALKTNVFIYYGPQGVPMGFVTYNGKDRTADVTVIHRPFGSDEFSREDGTVERGRAQARGYSLYDVWEPAISMVEGNPKLEWIEGRPPRLEQIINGNNPASPVMLSVRSYVSGYDAEGNPVEGSARIYLYEGTVPISTDGLTVDEPGAENHAFVPVEISRDNYGRLLARTMGDRREMIGRDQAGRPVEHTNFVFSGGAWVPVDSSEAAGMKGHSTVWTGRNLSTTQRWRFLVGPEGDREEQDDGFERDDGEFVPTQRSEYTYQSGPWAQLFGYFTTVRSAGIQIQNGDLDNGTVDWVGALRQFRLTTEVGYDDGIVGTDIDHLGMERTREFDEAVRLRAVTRGVPGQTEGRIEFDGYAQPPDQPKTTQQSFGGQSISDSDISQRVDIGTTPIVKIPAYLQELLLGNLKDKGLVRPDAANLATCGLPLRPEVVTDFRSGKTDTVYWIQGDGDAQERKLFSGRFGDRILDVDWDETGAAVHSFELTPDLKQVRYEYFPHPDWRTNPALLFESYRHVAQPLPGREANEYVEGMTAVYGDNPLRVVYRMPWVATTNERTGEVTYTEPTRAMRADWENYAAKTWQLINTDFYNTFVAVQYPERFGGDTSIVFWHLREAVHAPPGAAPYVWQRIMTERGSIELRLRYRKTVQFDEGKYRDQRGQAHRVIGAFETDTAGNLTLDANGRAVPIRNPIRPVDPSARGQTSAHHYDVASSDTRYLDYHIGQIHGLNGRRIAIEGYSLLATRVRRLSPRERDAVTGLPAVEIVVSDLDNPDDPVFGYLRDSGHFTVNWVIVHRYAKEEDGETVLYQDHFISRFEPLTRHRLHAPQSRFTIADLFRFNKRVKGGLREPGVGEEILKNTPWIAWVALAAGGAFLALQVIISILGGFSSFWNRVRYLRPLRRVREAAAPSGEEEPPAPLDEEPPLAPPGEETPPAPPAPPAGARTSAGDITRVVGEIRALYGEGRLSTPDEDEMGPDGRVVSTGWNTFIGQIEGFAADGRTYGYEAQNVRDVKLGVLETVRDELLLGHRPDDIISHTFRTGYENWRDEVLSRALGRAGRAEYEAETGAPFTLQDMLIRELVYGAGPVSGISAHDPLAGIPDYMEYLFYRARRAVRDGGDADTNIFDGEDLSLDREVRGIGKTIEVNVKLYRAPVYPQGHVLARFNTMLEFVTKDVRKHTLEHIVHNKDLNDLFRTPGFVRRLLTDAEFHERVLTYGDVLIELMYLASEQSGLPADFRTLLNDHVVRRVDSSPEYLARVLEAARESNGDAAALRSRLRRIWWRGEAPYVKTYRDIAGGWMGIRGILSIIRNDFWVREVPAIVIAYCMLGAGLLADRVTARFGYDTNFSQVTHDFLSALATLFSKFGLNFYELMNRMLGPVSEYFMGSPDAFSTPAGYWTALGVLLAAFILSFWFGLKNIVLFPVMLTVRILARVLEPVNATLRVLDKRLVDPLRKAPWGSVLTGTVVSTLVIGVLSYAVLHGLSGFVSPETIDGRIMVDTIVLIPAHAVVQAINWLWALPFVMAGAWFAKTWWSGLKFVNSPLQKYGEPVWASAGREGAKAGLADRTFRFVTVILPTMIVSAAIMFVGYYYGIKPVEQLLNMFTPDLKLFGEPLINEWLYRSYEVLGYLSAPVINVMLLTSSIIYVITGYTLYIIGRARSFYRIPAFSRLWSWVEQWKARRASRARQEPQEPVTVVREAANRARENAAAANRILPPSGARAAMVPLAPHYTRQESQAISALWGASERRDAGRLESLTNDRRRDLLTRLDLMLGKPSPHDLAPGALARHARRARQGIKAPDNLLVYDHLSDLRNAVRASLDPAWSHRLPPANDADHRARGMYRLLRETEFSGDPVEDRRMMELAWARRHNAAMTRIYRQGRMDEDELDRSLYAIERQDPGNYLSGRVTGEPGAITFADAETQREYNFFMSSYYDDTMHFSPEWDRIPPVFIGIPLYQEDMMLPIGTLDTVLNTGKSQLSILVARSHTRWLNLVRQWEQDPEMNPGGVNNSVFLALYGFRHGQSLTRGPGAVLDRENPSQRLIIEAIEEEFAGMEQQELIRTLEAVQELREGLMHTYLLSHPTADEAEVEAAVNEKLQLVFGHQVYGTAAQEVRDIADRLRRRFPWMELAYLDSRQVVEDGHPVQRQRGVLLQSDGTEIVKEYPTIGTAPQGKPFNLLHIDSFMRGRRAKLSIDVNQGISPLEAMFKGPALFATMMAHRTRVYKFSTIEDIQTGHVSTVGQAAKRVDENFNGMMLPYSLWGILSDYGHPNIYPRDTLRAVGHETQNPYVTEDVDAGNEANERGLINVFITWFQFRKGREVSIYNFMGMMNKFGVATQLLMARNRMRRNPELFRGSQVFDFTKAYIDANAQNASFFVRKILVMALLYVMVGVVVTFALSFFVVFPAAILLGVLSIPASELILNIDLAYSMLKEGNIRGFIKFIVMAPVMVAIFLPMLFVTGMSALFAVHGLGAYVGTGRGMNAAHKAPLAQMVYDEKKDTYNESDAEVYGIFRAREMKFALTLALIGVAGFMVYQSVAMLLTAIFLAVPFLFIIAVAVLFNPGGTPIGGFWAWARLWVSDLLRSSLAAILRFPIPHFIQTRLPWFLSWLSYFRAPSDVDRPIWLLPSYFVRLAHAASAGVFVIAVLTAGLVIGLTTGLMVRLPVWTASWALSRLGIGAILPEHKADIARRSAERRRPPPPAPAIAGARAAAAPEGVARRVFLKGFGLLTAGLALSGPGSLLKGQERQAPPRAVKPLEVDPDYPGFYDWSLDGEGRVLLRRGVSSGSAKAVERGASIYYLPVDDRPISDFLLSNQVSLLLAPLLPQDDPVWSDPAFEGIRDRAIKRAGDKKDRSRGEIDRIAQMGLSGIKIQQLPLVLEALDESDEFRKNPEVRRVKLILTRARRLYKEKTGRDLVIHELHNAGRYPLDALGAPRFDIPAGLSGAERDAAIAKALDVQKKVMARSTETYAGLVDVDQIDNETLLYVTRGLDAYEGPDDTGWEPWELGQAPLSVPGSEPRFATYPYTDYQNPDHLKGFTEYLVELAASAVEAQKRVSEKLGRTIRHPVTIGTGNTGIGDDLGRIGDDTFAKAFREANARRGNPVAAWAVNAHPRTYNDLDKPWGPEDEKIMERKLAEVDRRAQVAGVPWMLSEGGWPSNGHRGLATVLYMQKFGDALARVSKRVADLIWFSSHRRKLGAGEADARAGLDDMYGILDTPAEALMPQLGRVYSSGKLAFTASDIAAAAKAGRSGEYTVGKSRFFVLKFAAPLPLHGEGTIEVGVAKELAGKEVLVRLLPEGAKREAKTNLVRATVDQNGLVRIPLGSFVNRTKPFVEIDVYIGFSFETEGLAPSDVTIGLNAVSYEYGKPAAAPPAKAEPAVRERPAPGKKPVMEARPTVETTRVQLPSEAPAEEAPVPPTIPLMRRPGVFITAAGVMAAAAIAVRSWLNARRIEKIVGKTGRDTSGARLVDIILAQIKPDEGWPLIDRRMTPEDVFWGFVYTFIAMMAGGIIIGIVQGIRQAIHNAFVAIKLRQAFSVWDSTHAAASPELRRLVRVLLVTGNRERQIRAAEALAAMGADAEASLPALEAALLWSPRWVQRRAAYADPSVLNSYLYEELYVELYKDVHPLYGTIELALNEIRGAVRRRSMPDAVPPASAVPGELRADFTHRALKDRRIPVDQLTDPVLRDFLALLAGDPILNKALVMGGLVRDQFFGLQPGDNIDVTVMIDFTPEERADVYATASQPAGDIAERIFARSQPVLERLAEILDVDSDDFRREPGDPKTPKFQGREVNWLGPIDHYSQLFNHTRVLKQWVVDRKYRRMYASTTGVGLLQIAIAPDGELYGDIDSLAAAAEGRAVLTGDGRNLMVGDVLRLLRLKHELGLRISDEDRAQTRGVIVRHEYSPPTLYMLQRLIDKVIETANNAPAAQAELNEYGFPRLVEIARHKPNLSYWPNPTLPPGRPGRRPRQQRPPSTPPPAAPPAAPQSEGARVYVFDGQVYSKAVQELQSLDETLRRSYEDDSRATGEWALQSELVVNRENTAFRNLRRRAAQHTQAVLRSLDEARRRSEQPLETKERVSDAVRDAIERLRQLKASLNQILNYQLEESARVLGQGPFLLEAQQEIREKSRPATFMRHMDLLINDLLEHYIDSPGARVVPPSSDVVAVLSTAGRTDAASLIRDLNGLKRAAELRPGKAFRVIVMDGQDLISDAALDLMNTETDAQNKPLYPFAIERAAAAGQSASDILEKNTPANAAGILIGPNGLDPAALKIKIYEEVLKGDAQRFRAGLESLLEGRSGTAEKVTALLRAGELAGLVAELPGQEARNYILDNLPSIEPMDLYLWTALRTLAREEDGSYTADLPEGAVQAYKGSDDRRRVVALTAESLRSEQIPMAVNKAALLAQLGANSEDVKFVLLASSQAEADDLFGAGQRINRSDFDGVALLPAAQAKTSEVFDAVNSALPDAGVRPEHLMIVGGQKTAGVSEIDFDAVDATTPEGVRELNRNAVLLEVPKDQLTAWILLTLFRKGKPGEKVYFTPQKADWEEIRRRTELTEAMHAQAA